MNTRFGFLNKSFGVLGSGLVALIFGACESGAMVAKNRFLPELSLDLPAKEMARLEDQNFSTGATGILIQRMNQAVVRTNRLISRLNLDGVSTVGTFTGLGPDSDLQGVVEGLEENADGFDYQATICSSGRPFQRMRWNKKFERIEVIRDFSVDPISANDATREPFIGKFIVDARDAAAVKTTFRSTGAPWVVPSDIEYFEVSDFAEATVNESGTILLRGVADWYSSSFPAVSVGDNYVLASLGSDASSGRALGYRQTGSRCETSFDESDPNWCDGFDFSNKWELPEDSLHSTWIKLKAQTGLSIPSEIALQEVQFPSDASCE